MTAFRADSLPVSPSLNRVVLVHIPGVTAGFAGAPAHDWLATWSIAWLIETEPDVVAGIRGLGIDVPSLPPGREVTPELMVAAIDWPRGLDVLLQNATDSDAYAGGLRVAARLGEALGTLVYTLVTGPVAARVVRPDWPDERWDRWARVRRIVIGGGNVRGEVGARMVAEARRVLDTAGVRVDLTLAPEPESLVLRGAASLLDDGVAIDCGGTNLKTSRVQSALLAGAPVQVPAPGRVGAEEVLDTMVRALLPMIPSGDGPVAVSIALATYVDETGQPYADQLGTYAPLGHVEIYNAFAEAVARHTDRRLVPMFLHDGAAALAGARHKDRDTDAAIVLGTAIGSGLS